MAKKQFRAEYSARLENPKTEAQQHETNHGEQKDT
jgi:hypothetical protein